MEAIICIQCHHPVLPPTGLPQHVHSHISALVVPFILVDTIIEKFQLDETIRYPTKIIPPIYGIPVLEEPHYFCQPCNRGYQSLENLRSHQSRNQCTGYALGYGQLIPGLHRRIIQVQLDGLLKKQDLNVDYHSLFRQGTSSRPDYSKTLIPIAENESNLSAFFRQDGWLTHVQGNTPVDLYEARRNHEKEDTLGDAIRQASRRYLVQIQTQIEQNINYGLLKNIATTNV